MPGPRCIIGDSTLLGMGFARRSRSIIWQNWPGILLEACEKAVGRIISLKVAEVLDSWPEAAFSLELQRYLEGARERTRKQEEYYRQRARAAAKAKLKPSMAEMPL